MLFVEVLLAMMPIVVRFVLLIAILLLVPTGTLVLLYHLNCTHYPRRGGASYSDISCGVFIIYFNIVDSATYWDHGAALE